MCGRRPSPRESARNEMELPGSIKVLKVNVDIEEEGGKLSQKYPPNLLALAPTLHVPIGPGDTVKFPGDTILDSTFQWYHGRIIQIFVDPAVMPGGEEIPFHPEAHHEDGEPIALIHLALTKRQSLNLFPHSIWHAHSKEVMHATNGIEEYSFTDLLV